MIFPDSIVDHIAQSAYWADRSIRSELARGIIAGEIDYSSNLTAAFRRQINARAILGLHATSYLLKPSAERAVGADGCIVLSDTKEFKICLFEAKWPQLRTKRDCWDSLQRSSGVSHFHEQLSRQSAISNLFAVWEMFYCEFPFDEQPPFMPSHVSSCVWHEHAYAASQARPNRKTPWTDVELSALLDKHGSRIDELIRKVCACEAGVAIRGNDYLRVFEEYQVPRELLVIEYAGPQQQ